MSRMVVRIKKKKEDLFNMYNMYDHLALGTERLIALPSHLSPSNYRHLSRSFFDPIFMNPHPLNSPSMRKNLID